MKIILTALFALLSATIFAQCSVNAGPDLTICPGGNSTIGNLTPPTGTAPFTYSWSPVTNLSCTSCPQPVASPSVTTTYTVTLTDGTNCISTDDVTISVSGVPNAAFIFLPNNVCASTPIQFSASNTAPGVTYSWNFGNPASGAANTTNLKDPSHTFVSTGSSSQNFTVTLIATNANGCQSTSVQTVTIKQIPDAVLLDPITNFKNCQGTNFPLEVYDGSTGTNSNYQIIWGDGTPDYNSSTFPPSIVHTYLTSEIFDLYFIVTGTNGCTKTSHEIVANITNPAIGAANPGATTGCGPLTLCFPLSNYLTNHNSTIYVVDYGDNTPNDTLSHPAPTEICHTYTESSCGEPGNAYIFSIEAINSCDNSIATITPIRVYTKPTANFSATPVPACVNSPVSFTNTSILGYNSACNATTIFKWNFGDGSPILQQFTRLNASHSYSLPGVYTVTLTAENGCGISTFVRTVCIEAAPIPFFTISPETACIPFNTTVVNTSDTANRCNVTYLWSVIFNGSTCLPSAGTWSYINGTNQNSWQPQFKFSSPGTYFTRLTLTNSCGIFTYQDTIIAQGPPQLTLSAIGSICANESITPTAVVNHCYELTDTYNWTFTGGIPNTSSILTPGTIQYPSAGNFTVNLQATNSCGTTNRSVPIVVNAPPIANAGANLSICSGLSSGVGSPNVSGITYSWSPATNLSNASVSQPNFSSLNATGIPITTQYILTASTSSTCFSKDTLLVTVNPKPILAASNQTICFGGSVPLSVSGAGSGGSYNWTANPSLSCLNCDNPIATPVATSTYTVTGTNQYGCASSTNVNVTVKPLPIVNAGLNQNLCDQPISVQLNGSPTGGSWTGSTHVTPSGLFTPNGAEIATIIYTYTNPSTSCSNRDTLIITVNPAIVPTINPTDSLCRNSGIVNLTSLLNTTPTGGTYAGVGVSGVNFNPSTAGVGIHQVVYTFGTGTCQSSDTALITVLSIPVLSSPNSTICFRDTVGLSVTGAGIGGTYTWSPATSLSCMNCPNPFASPSATTNYTIVGTDVNGCSSTTNSNLIVNPLPIVNAGANQILCDQPIAVQLNGTPSGGTWSGSPHVSVAGLFTPNGAEIATIVYSYTHPISSCKNSDTLIITVNPPIIPIINPTDSLCRNAGIVNLTTLLNTTPTGGTYAGVGVSGANFNPSTAGVGIHQVAYTFGTGTCQSSDTALITVLPVPILVSPNSTICFRDTVGLTVTGAGIGGTYTWSPATSLSCTNCPNPFASPTITTNYTIVGTDVNGCSSTLNSTVSVNPLPVVNAGADQVLCDQPIAVQLNGTPAGGTWTGSPNLSSSGSFLPSGSENSSAIYTAFNALTGCTNSDTAQLTVSPPVFPIFTQGQRICFSAAAVNLNTFLSVNPIGGSWSGSGVLGTNFTPSIAGVGTHTLTYTIGSGTCQTISTVNVTVDPQPIITASDAVICVGQTTSLLAAGAGVGGSYAWSPAVGLSCANCANPDASPIVTTNYTVLGTTQFGCASSKIVIVNVNPLPVAQAGPDTVLCNLPVGVLFNGQQTGGVWSGPNIAANGLFTPTGTGNFNVTYTVTLGTGCVSSDSRLVAVVDPAQAVAGPDLEACIGSGNVNLIGTPANGIWTGSIVASNGVVSTNTAGTFNLIYSYGTGNCLTKDTMQFIIHSLPIVNAGNDFAMCISSGVEYFNGNPLAGVWSGTGITNSTSGEFDPLVATVGNHILTYTFTDPTTTCVQSDQKTVTVNPLPIVDFTVDPIVCLGVSVPILNTSSLINGSSWDFGDGGISIQNNPNHTFSSTGFFTIQLIVTTVNGCQDSISKIIEVQEPPVANFNVAPDSLCGPLNAVFTNTSSGIDVTYNWDFGNGQTSILQNPAPLTYFASLISDTNYLVNLDVTNYCGTVSHQEIVIVMPQPKAIFGTNLNTGCSPFTVIIGNASVGLADNYFWDFGDGTTGTSSSSVLNHVYTTGSTATLYQIMLVAYNECGSDTTYQSITVLPNTVDAFFNTNVTSGCEDLTVDFTQYTIGGTFYSWNFGDGNTSTNYSPSHTFTTPGTFTVSLFANDGCGYDTTEVVITVFPSPVISFNSSPDSVCINTPFIFQNTSLNLASSSWDFGDGTTSNLTNPTHEYPIAGLYNVTLSGASLTNGCVSQITHSVNVSLNPVASFTALPMSGCMPLIVQFTNQSANTSFSYWNFGDGNTSGAINPTHTFTAAGVYTVRLIAENANGCSDTISQNITVYPLPVADFSYTSSSTCYTPTDFVFTNLSSGAINYDWDFGNGLTSNLTNPSVTYQNAGNYTIRLTATNQYGCQSVFTKQVTIYPTPQAAFQLPTNVACENDVLNFVSASNFADSIVWILGDGSVLTGSSIQYSYLNSGIYPVTVMAYGAGGCGDTLTFATPITIHPDPIANFSYVNVQIPDPVSGTVEFTNLSSGANQYQWEFGNGGSSTDLDPIHRYQSYGEFEVLLIAKNSFGCVDSIYKAIRVTFFNGLFLPNAMYPDHSDFEVSHFVPKGVGLKTFMVQIYDDWGNIIWESNVLDGNGRPTESWDGTYQGNKVQQDAYVWKVVATFLDESVWGGKEYPDGIYRQAGTVTVIR